MTLASFRKRMELSHNKCGALMSTALFFLRPGKLQAEV